MDRECDPEKTHNLTIKICAKPLNFLKKLFS